MKFVQWIFTIIGVLLALLLLIGGSFFPFLLVLISLILVAPPLQQQINQRLPWLRFGFLKLLLGFILWFAAFAFTGNSIVSFSELAVCTEPTNGLCEKHNIAVLEKTQQLSVSASLGQGDAAEQAKVTMEYWPEPDQESEVYSQVFDLPPGAEQILLTLERLDLQPGNYRVNLTPEGIGQQDSLTVKRRFSVWTDEQDVTKRNESELDDAGLNNSVAEVKICEGSEDVEEPCKEHLSELSTQIKYLAFTAEIPNFKLRTARTRGDSEITFILRYLGSSLEEPEEAVLIFRETSELDREVGTYTLVIPGEEEGFLPGVFELLTSLETRSSAPIRKQFTLK